MHRYLVILFLLGILKANDGGTIYISPGIQIGMNSKGNFFISGQITFGLLIDDTVIGDAVPIGLTLGKRWYKIEKKSWEKYNYIDAQFWPYYAGWGLGIMIDKNRSMYPRFKCGAGLFGYLTYDYFKVFEANYGLIGVLPIPESEMF